MKRNDEIDIGKIDKDFLPNILKLDYELVKTKGKLDGTRYKCNRGVTKSRGPDKN